LDARERASAEIASGTSCGGAPTLPPIQLICHGRPHCCQIDACACRGTDRGARQQWRHLRR